jgi:hypothetical protein
LAGRILAIMALYAGSPPAWGEEIARAFAASDAHDVRSLVLTRATYAFDDGSGEEPAATVDAVPLPQPRGRSLPDKLIHEPDRNGRLDAEVLDTSILSLKVMGRVVDSAGAEVSSNADAPDTRTYRGSIAVSALEDRLRLTSGYAPPDRADAARSERVDAIMGTGAVPGAPVTARHRVDMRLTNEDGDGPQISAFGQYGHFGPVERPAEAFGSGERSRTEFGITSAFGPFTFGLTRTAFATEAETIESELTTVQRTDELRAELSLAPLRDAVAGALIARGLTPARIAWSRRGTRIDPLDVERDTDWSADGMIERQAMTTHTIAPSWDWPMGRTTIALTRTLWDSSVRGTPTAATDTHAVDLTQSIQGDGWIGSLQLGYGDVDRRDAFAASVESRYRGGAELRLTPPGLPDLATNLRFASSRTSPLETGGSSANGSWRFGSGLDFAKFLPRAAGHEPTLKLAGQVRGTEWRDAATAGATLDWAVTLVGGLKF